MTKKIKYTSAKAESFLLSLTRALHNGKITLGDYYKRPSSVKLAAYDACRTWYTRKNARIIAVTSATCHYFTLMALVGSTLYVETGMNTYQVELPTYEVWNFLELMGEMA